MAIGSVIYYVLIGIGECWVGIMLLIIALIKRRESLMYAGCGIQLFLSLLYIIPDGLNISNISGIIFILCFSYVVSKVIPFLDRRHYKKYVKKLSTHNTEEQDVDREILSYASGNEESDDKINFCRKCGTRIVDNSNFCYKCGTEIFVEKK